MSKRLLRGIALKAEDSIRGARLPLWWPKDAVKQVVSDLRDQLAEGEAYVFTSHEKRALDICAKVYKAGLSPDGAVMVQALTYSGIPEADAVNAVLAGGNPHRLGFSISAAVKTKRYGDVLEITEASDPRVLLIMNMERDRIVRSELYVPKRRQN